MKLLELAQHSFIYLIQNRLDSFAKGVFQVYTPMPNVLNEATFEPFRPMVQNH